MDDRKEANPDPPPQQLLITVWKVILLRSYPRRRGRMDRKERDRRRTLARLRSARMRRFPTPSEELLAGALRKAGYRFRQQASLYDESRLYIVDFLVSVYGGKIVIEIDGPCHQKTSAYDEARDRWIVSQRGYKVFRFSSKDIYDNLPRVLGILRAWSPLTS